MKASVYIATSLDGFIARENGSLDWLPQPDTDIGSTDSDAADAGGDMGFQAFMASIDAMVMGRNTFETVLSFGQWPYGDTPVIVLSRRGAEIPDHLTTTVETSSKSLHELVEHLSARGLEHLYVDGGSTIQSFLNESLITQFIITRIPVLIGSGIPLFGPLEQDVHLNHVETISMPQGMVQSTYEVIG